MIRGATPQKSEHGSYGRINGAITRRGGSVESTLQIISSLTLPWKVSLRLIWLNAFDVSISEKFKGRLFHNQIILYGFDPVDGPGDFNGFIDGFLSINKTTQLNNALVSFDTDLE